MNRVVITGLGAVTPIGNNVIDMWESVKKNVGGIGSITRYDTSGQKVKLAAEVKIDIDEYLPKNVSRRMDRYTKLAVIAANEAFNDCGITAENSDLNRCGIIFSSGIGGMATIEKEHSKGLDKGFDRVSPFFIPMTISNIAAGYIAINTGFRGHCVCPVTACAGGNNAIGDGFHKIRHGYLDAVICGGSESSITPLSIGGFTSMKAINETGDVSRASIPFDKERNGFIMGEGAGCLVLEELEHAKARGANIYAEVLGYGSTCDAYHITAPHPEGEGGVRCMEMAIKDAGLKPEDIEYINAHGTSTDLNDKGETIAIKMVFGSQAYKIPVSSTKSMTGHLLGAAGAVEGIISVLAIRDSFVPATINYRIPDEECDLDVVPNMGRKQEIRYAMSNSFGFGGHNAIIIFGRYTKE